MIEFYSYVCAVNVLPDEVDDLLGSLLQQSYVQSADMSYVSTKLAYSGVVHVEDGQSLNVLFSLLHQL